MDTSETYIKMCEKAVEIQELRKGNTTTLEGIEPWLEGDFFYIPPDDFAGYVAIAFDCDDTYYSKPKFEDMAIWLPRQDQLQEMLPQDKPSNRIKVMLASKFAHFVAQERKYDATWEQYWLAFVMKENYNKVWNGEDWINAPKQ